MILRMICAVTTALTCAVAVCGCASNNDSSADSSADSKIAVVKSESRITAESVLKEISDDNMGASAYYGEELFANNCQALYGVTADELSDGGIIYAADGGLADEISVISSDKVDCQEILANRVAARLKTFENYKPEECGKIDNAQIFEKDNLWVLVISDNAQELKTEIENYDEG